jgi:GT2 family glycosyltransferase
VKVPREPRISVVVISRNEGEWLRDTVSNLADTLPPASEIIVVDDMSEDGSTRFVKKDKRARLIRASGIGVARARNVGGLAASGHIIVFADAHLRLPPRWWLPLIEVLREPAAGAAAPAVGNVRKPDSFGYGFGLPHPDLIPKWLFDDPGKPFHAPVLPGCCLAVRRDAFEAIGGFDDGLLARGGVDAETSLRLWLAGFENWVVPESRILHYFRQCAPFEVTEEEVLHNRLRLAMVHLNKKRIEQVLRAYRKDPVLEDALHLVELGGANQRRRELIQRRSRTDNWFFKRFKIAW